MTTTALAAPAALAASAMEGSAERFGSVGLNGYQLRLPSFEGPLDVLLRLIEREQLAIADVSLIAVTDQFVAHLASLEGAAAATIAEFAAVAGRLVLLKSRSLLPRPPVVEEPEPHDLVRQLEEYRALRAAADRLQAADRTAAASFARGGGIVSPAAPPPRLALHQAAALARALRRRLTSATPPLLPLGVRRVVSLREMAERLLARLGESRSGQLGFRDFCAEIEDRTEVMIGFLAVLSLVRRRVLVVDQDVLFGEIRIRRDVAPRADVAATLPEAADD